MRATPKLTRRTPSFATAEPATCELLEHFPHPATEHLDTFCRNLCSQSEWALAQLWVPREGLLRCAASWFDDAELSQFCQISELCTLGPGIDLPGEAWASSQVTWVNDAARESRLPRASVAETAGLHTAFAFPLSGNGQTIGAVEVFSRDLRQNGSGAAEFIAAAARRALADVPAAARRRA